jgi:hypothetical protein
MLNRIAVLLCLQFWLCASAAQPEEKRPPLEESKVVAYGKAFAKRFGLPEPSPEAEMTEGMEAVEFRVELARRPGTPFRCKLRIYLRAGLPIAFPKEGGSATRDPLTLPEHFLFDRNENNKRWQALTPEDRIHFRNEDTFGRSAALASPDLDLPKKGYWADLSYDAFYRGVFPGIDYIRLDSDCGAFADIKNNREVQLWLKREGGRDYRYAVIPDPKDFLKFSISSAFLASAGKWARPADEKNRAALPKPQK